MIRTTARGLLVAVAALAGLAAGAGAAATDPIPQFSGGRRPDYEADEILTARTGVLEPLVDASQRWQYKGELPYKDVLVGSYVRAEEHLKLGAFYRLQYGARHNDDWSQATPSSPWGWRNTTDRPESVLVLDATPRARLPFLPGGNWTGSLKLRYEYNLFDREETLKVEPELAWFWLDGLTPRATVFLRYETDLALNFGDARVWARWWYLAALWHAKPWLSLGPQVALRDETWTTSSPWRASNPGSSYTVLYRSWVPGFTVVARLP